MGSAANALVFAVLTLCSIASCTDDFARFQFGQKTPARARDSGVENMSDATGTDLDGGAGEGTAQSE